MAREANNDPRQKHIPVLPQAVLEYLAPESGPLKFIDGTLGCGGHSSLILQKNRQAELLGIDRDAEAIDEARKVLNFASERVHLVRGRFSDLADHATDVGWAEVDAILLDVGISSLQLDAAERGFSYQLNGPLDMRMDRRIPSTASRILNQASEAELAEIFFKYGEISKSRRLARAIVAKRKERPWMNTGELAELCEKVLGRARPGGPPAPTLCFQALRIAVNGELQELETALEKAIPLLKTGGRIGVISFHSLEDRIVKKFFRREATDCLCPPGLPVCVCRHQAQLRILTRKPVTAEPGEIAENPRAKPAKFRVAERIR